MKVAVTNELPQTSLCNLVTTSPETLRSPLPAHSGSSASVTLIAIVDRACTYVPADKYQSRTRRESRIAQMRAHNGGSAAYGCSKRSHSRRAQVYAAMMEVSGVVKVVSASSMNASLSNIRVRAVCGRLTSLRKGDVFWLACEPECNDVWADCGIGIVNQSRSARGNKNFNVRWSGAAGARWRLLAAEGGGWREDVGHSTAAAEG
jgi:hypothetical protein